jgi:hypothetical protein
MSGWDRIRKAAAGWMSEEEHLKGIEDGVNSLKAHGLVPAHLPWQQQPGTTFDTGHYMGSVLGGESGKWTTYISHNADPHLRRVIQIEHGDLGGQHSRLGEAVSQSLRRPDVMQSMREQMEHRDADEPSWIRRF